MASKEPEITHIALGTNNIDRVDSYVYLGRFIKLTHGLNDELARRKRAAWGAYNNIKEVLQKLTNVELRAQLFNSTVLPALCYASETWACTAQDLKKLQVTHRAIERRMLGITLYQQREQGISSADMRTRSKLRDPLEFSMKAKHAWAGHVARQNDRWTRRLTEWIPRGHKRPTGRPPTRWSDPIRKCHSERFSGSWMTTARNRQTWKECWNPLAYGVNWRINPVTQ